MVGPIMIDYKNVATGHIASYEKGSRLERKAAANTQKFKRMTKETIEYNKKPDKEKSG